MIIHDNNNWSHILRSNQLSFKTSKQSPCYLTGQPLPRCELRARLLENRCARSRPTSLLLAINGADQGSDLRSGFRIFVRVFRMINMLVWIQWIINIVYWSIEGFYQKYVNYKLCHIFLGSSGAISLSFETLWNEISNEYNNWVVTNNTWESPNCMVRTGQPWQWSLSNQLTIYVWLSFTCIIELFYSQPCLQWLPKKGWRSYKGDVWHD